MNVNHKQIDMRKDQHGTGTRGEGSTGISVAAPALMRTSVCFCMFIDEPLPFD
jgi:hypothetical protein